MNNPSLHVRGNNRLLELLPTAERRRMISSMEHCAVARRDIVYSRHSLLTHVDFPLHGVVSLAIVMANGVSTEVGMVGNEGMAGLGLLMGSSTQGPTTAFYQVPGEALRMSARDFRREIGRRGRFEEIMQLYAQAFFNQVAQSTACNRLHPVEKRLCRWLLMCHDRMGSDTIHLTQEFVAQMLGVRRATVTSVAAVLQRAGFIRYRRGVIQIMDRGALEGSCCECYAAVCQDAERLLS